MSIKPKFKINIERNSLKSILLPVLAILSNLSPTMASELFEKEMLFQDVKKFTTHGLCANVTITTLPKDMESVVLNFKGDHRLEDFLNKLEITNRNGTLALEGNSSHNNSNIVIGNNAFIGNVSGNSRVIVNGVDITKLKPGKALAIPDLNVVLSQKTFLDLSAAGGLWNIGETSSSFQASLSGGCIMNASTISADVDIDISGSGKFTAKKICGDQVDASITGSGSLTLDSIDLKSASLKVTGSGDMKIKDGNISKKVTGAVTGSGKIKSMATVQDAKLKVTGSGTIAISKVTGELKRNVSGSGRIKVSNRPEEKSKKKQNNNNNSFICVVGGHTNGMNFVYGNNNVIIRK